MAGKWRIVPLGQLSALRGAFLEPDSRPAASNHTYLDPLPNTNQGGRGYVPIGRSAVRL